MNTLTDRQYRIITRILAEVARQPDVDVELMQKVIRYVVEAALDGDSETFYPAWFHDRIKNKLAELELRTSVPEGVSPHTRVVSLDRLRATGS